MNFLVVRLVVWVITLIAFPIPVNLFPRSFQVEVLEIQGITPGALPQERPLGWTERVLVYLERVQKKEIDPWRRDDLQIAWITVVNAKHGSPIPHIEATYTVLGCHPDKVWPWIVAWRKARLGDEYAAWYDGNGNLQPQSVTWELPPKKPVQMELHFARRARDAA